MENTEIKSRSLEGGNDDFFAFQHPAVSPEPVSGTLRSESIAPSLPSGDDVPARVEPIDHPVSDDIATTVLPEVDNQQISAGDDLQDTENDPVVDNVIDQQEAEVEFQGNALALMAKHWAEKGLISLEDSDIDESSFGVEDLDNLLLKSRENALKTEIQFKLAEDEGLNPETLKWFKSAWLGIQPEEVLEVNQYRSLGQFRPNPESDTYDTELYQYLLMHHVAKGYDEVQASKYVSADMETEESIETALNAANQFFTNTANEKASSIREREEKEEKERQDKRKANLDKMTELLDRGEFGGKKFTKQQVEQLRRGIFDKTEILTMPNGQTRRVSLLELKKHEARNSIEADLLHSAYLLLGTDVTEVEEKNQRQANKSILSDLAKMAKIKQPGRSMPSGGAAVTNGIKQEEL